MSFETELLALLPRLRRFARSLTGTGHDADDLCQMAIERALKSRAQWQDGTRLDSWMYTITRNIWIDTRRSAARRPVAAAGENALARVAGPGAGSVEAHVELANVERAMQALPPDQREAVSLVLVEGMTYAEAAEILAIPPGTLTSRLVRGRQALMRELGEAA